MLYVKAFVAAVAISMLAQPTHAYKGKGKGKEKQEEDPPRGGTGGLGLLPVIIDKLWDYFTDVAGNKIKEEIEEAWEKHNHKHDHKHDHDNGHNNDHEPHEPLEVDTFHAPHGVPQVIFDRCTASLSAETINKMKIRGPVSHHGFQIDGIPETCMHLASLLADDDVVGGLYPRPTTCGNDCLIYDYLSTKEYRSVGIPLEVWFNLKEDD